MIRAAGWLAAATIALVGYIALGPFIFAAYVAAEAARIAAHGLRRLPWPVAALVAAPALVGLVEWANRASDRRRRRRENNRWTRSATT